MPGATDEYTTFRMSIKPSFQFNNNTKKNSLSSSGIVSGLIVTLGVRDNRREFDLHDPNSISEITEYILTGQMWQ